MKARWNNMTTRDRIINVLIIVLSVAVLLGGRAIGIVSIVRIQKKYNGGVF